MTISVNTRLSGDGKSVDVILEINSKIICLGYFSKDALVDLAEEFRYIANELEWRSFCDSAC